MPNFDFNDYGITAEDFVNESQSILEDLTQDKTDHGLFKLKSANQWLKELMIPNPQGDVTRTDILLHLESKK